MRKVLRFLLPDRQQRCSTAAFLLVARVVFALLLASHGLQKLEGFGQMSGGFPDPLGLGSGLSLLLAIFGELVCSLALVVGVLSRLVLLPMIFTMCVVPFSWLMVAQWPRANWLLFTLWCSSCCFLQVLVVSP